MKEVDENGDINIENKESRHELLGLIKRHIKTHRLKLRQAKLIGSEYRIKKELEDIEYFTSLYWKIANRYSYNDKDKKESTK